MMSDMFSKISSGIAPWHVVIRTRGVEMELSNKGCQLADFVGCQCTVVEPMTEQCVFGEAMHLDRVLDRHATTVDLQLALVQR